jgi:hypothetical protein
MRSHPYVKGSDTSEAAAASLPDQAPLKEQIVKLIARAYVRGVTCSEIELLIPHKSHQSLSARIRELVLDGAIYDSGDRRPGSSGRSQRVYQLDRRKGNPVR